MCLICGGDDLSQLTILNCANCPMITNTPSIAKLK